MTRSKKQSNATPVPGKDEILRFIQDTPGRVSKREIARAFGVKGDDRVELKRILQEMAREGMIDRGRRKEVRQAGALPNVLMIEITGPDVDGELLARPTRWTEKDAPPKIYMAPNDGSSSRLPALGPGDRLLARLTPVDGHYEARTIKRLDQAPQEILGVYRLHDGQGRLVPTDRKARHDFVVAPEDAGNANPGDLVLARLLPGGRSRLGLKPVVIKQNLGNMGHPKSISLIAIHTHGIPVDFSPEALKEARAAKPVTLGDRLDLRDLALVTIDPEDARDHDDAVWAAPDETGENEGGWEVIVAIADVSWYVRPGSALDDAALERGNSTYFPDRVVPMLPEELSTDLCSLKAGVDRPCLAVRMVFDAEGNKLRHRFHRALMRSRGDLTYSRVQRVHEGHGDPEIDGEVDAVIRHLFGAYKSVLKERARRDPLELDLPERKIELTPDGAVRGVAFRERFDAHKLIEEFMIRANVAAAETLEKTKLPCMYRVHEEPALDKLEALRNFLHTLDLILPKGQVLRPKQFNGLLARVAQSPHVHVVNEVVLRSQSQAYYAPGNMGHFGLALERYAHFTSPIRRYADLLVHRALVRGLKLGQGGLTDEEAEHFSEIGTDISRLERRSMTAEREATDRYLAAFLADRVGADFQGRISGVTRFGLFVALTDTGADGIIPMSSLGHDYFIHDEENHALVGRHTGDTYRLGDRVTVRLIEASPVTGGLRFEMLSDAPARSKAPARPGGKGRGKPKRSKRR
jgi:ribonuclease R